MSTDKKFSIKYLQTKFNNTFTMHLDQVDFILRMPGWFNICKSMNVIQHINRIKDKNCMILSTAEEKAFNNFQYPFFLKFLLFICAFNVWSISPAFPLPLPFSPAPSLSPLPPHYQAETILPLSLILLKKEISNDRKDQGFLLVEIRIAIQGGYLHCFPVHMCYILN
jgi:hypothetical protein